MRAVVFAVSICVMQLMPALGTCAADADDSWDNLGRVNRSRTYTFMDRDSLCVGGRIASFTDQSVTVQTTRWRRSAAGKMTVDQGVVTLERPKVMLVGEDARIGDALYSGRSSWSDLKDIHLEPGESVTIVTTDGKHHNGKLGAAGENQVTLTRSGREVKFSKSDVRRFYYVRSKPLSDSGADAAREAVFLDPELWPYLLGITPKVRVLLYDSSVPEDNAPLHCKSDP